MKQTTKKRSILQNLNMEDISGADYKNTNKKVGKILN